MKKVLLTAAAVLSLTFVNAQDLKSKKGEAYLPVAGDWAISFNANGLFEYAGNAFNGKLNNVAPTVGFVTESNNSFVGKKFISEKMAYRVVANLGFKSNKTNAAGTGTFVGSNLETKTSNFDLTAGLGKEWRKGSTRLQGYYGADALINIKSGSTEISYTDDVTGVYEGRSKVKNGLGLGLGAQGFLGAEYFIFPKFAIGAQYTYRVGFNVQGKSETTNSPAVGPPTTTNGLNGTSKFEVGSVAVTSINLTLHF